MMYGSYVGGLFITFEGGEGCGKTTQLRLLEEKIKSKGIDAIFTREPGGTPAGEAIRAALLTGDIDKWTPNDETLLNSAARLIHMNTVIKPALNKGQWVISDRFADSTTVYQGYVQGVPMSNIETMHNAVVGEYGWPDLTIVLDIPVDVGLSRKGKQADEGLKETRMESHGKEFHEKVRAGFLKLAKENPDRIVVIDATGTVEEIEELIWAAIEKENERAKASLS